MNDNSNITTNNLDTVEKYITTNEHLNITNEAVY